MRGYSTIPSSIHSFCVHSFIFLNTMTRRTAFLSLYTSQPSLLLLLYLPHTFRITLLRLHRLDGENNLTAFLFIIQDRQEEDVLVVSVGSVVQSLMAAACRASTEITFTLSFGGCVALAGSKDAGLIDAPLCLMADLVQIFLTVIVASSSCGKWSFIVLLQSRRMADVVMRTTKATPL